ncbi:GNAT family N-acetyltransferase [Nonomuraea sp. NPDC050310]|uniref:GNAT family N-acetyltransferase n=1 Tax=unclassified Nonomuraea TaxID=2593643 RepID=UPI0033EF6EDD
MTATFPAGVVGYRGFQAGDEAGLVEAWNLSLPADPTTRRWVRDRVLLDPNFDPAGLRVAVLDGRVVGCAYAVRRLVPLSPYAAGTETEAGWIPFFFVEPGIRGSGVGRRLVGEALDFLAREGRNRVDVAGYTPNYVAPGLDLELYPQARGLLEKLGFRVVTTALAMDRSLVGYAPPSEVLELAAKRLAEGYEVGCPADGELPELVRFAGTGFNPDWAEAIRRFPDNERLLVVRKDGRIAGFTAYGAYQGPAERFGPFGVDPAERGTGLGKILLHRTLARMRAEGLHGAWFLWTGEDSPAARLYLGAGFSITRTYHLMRWTSR